MLIAVPLAFLAVILAIGGAVTIESRRRTARDTADDLEAARLRLLAAGEDVDGIGGARPRPGTVYASRIAAAAHTAPADQRIADIADDPGLTADDVATAVEHVAPGVGSLASFARVASDTREMRTNAEQHEMDAVYDAAHNEDIRRDMDRAFAGSADDDVAKASRAAWAAIDAWVEKYHGAVHYADCIHCLRVHDEHSDEYALIVADRVNTDTGAWDVRELRAALAAA